MEAATHACHSGQLLSEKFSYTVAAGSIAQRLGLKNRINIIMQTAFFMISGVIPADRAMHMIAQAIKKTYAHKDPKVVDLNLQAMSAAADAMVPVPHGEVVPDQPLIKTVVAGSESAFIRTVVPLIQMAGDHLRYLPYRLMGSGQRIPHDWKTRCWCRQFQCGIQIPVCNVINVPLFAPCRHTS